MYIEPHSIVTVVNKIENVPDSWCLSSIRKVGHKHSHNYIIKCCDNFYEVN